MIKKIYQDWQQEKKYWGKALLIKKIEDLGENGTFILEDYKTVKEWDEWGNCHKVRYPIPMTQLDVYSSKKYLVEFVESDVFPVGFRKIVSIRYLYSKGVELKPDELEEDLPEVTVDDSLDEDSKSFERIRIDKFIEVNGEQCF